MSANLTDVLKRFKVEGFPPRIDCGEGWHQLLVSLDKEIAEIDPDYRIAQIKEKFGTLRYYIDTDVSKRKKERMHTIIARYEVLSSKTCELTGGPGRLMRMNGWYKIYDPAVAPEGYEIV